LLREVFSQQYEVDQDGKTSTSSVESIEPVKVHGSGVVQNPHDPDAQWLAKGQGKKKKDWVGYKVQVVETVAVNWPDLPPPSICLGTASRSMRRPTRS
jgi:hypothetical protein